MTPHPFTAPVRNTFSWCGSALAVLLVLGGCGTSPGPTPQARCEGFRGRTLEGAQITGAELVAASGQLPEYCKVSGMLPPSLHFEVRLPTSWNGKTVHVGGGGFDGSIPSGDVYTQKGYVSIASDGGHTGDVLDASFALDPQKLDDFAYLSTHRVLPIAKALILERYGKSSTKTYFEGCSNGGREALIEAQRWPEDFDGIIARAPAYNFVELLIAFNRNTRQLSKPGAGLSSAKLMVLGKAVLDACDAKDGVADGIISHPSTCQFDPAVLQCPGAEQNDCLTAEQVTSVRTIYSPMSLNGTTVNQGWPVGGEADPEGWSGWITGNGNASLSAAGIFGSGLIKFFITRDPNFDPLTFNPNDWLSQINTMSGLVSANSTDLERFRARGGKLILWHGGTDAAISQKGTDVYYENLVQAAGGQAAADTFVEYFPAPGVNHCFGGAGADAVDLLTPLENWVEKGVPPSQAGLVAVKLNPQTGGTVLSRPLCKYPQYPRYNGSGDVASAGSFTCVNP
ncbi:tannase/feruloyl esterase family alpha/beta hydrolase [Archangium violaceum]|uniref:tannase/feruloyl esterase family alpha/beta hydrolase n=1 Tax=Archangium violaceum TaxID=83451 RepID=UPI00194F259E|nr:tannase/feruloyl esterase family alpha/beta hydrolase [Archangium violaceum]QRO02022.1 tannase/feruloyl esterase family alpha/beta hydrolase [Archangium violaceum]